MNIGTLKDGEFTSCMDQPCAGRLERGPHGCVCGFYSLADLMFASQHAMTAMTREEFVTFYKKNRPARVKGSGFSSRRSFR
jgi:hypothetical protein